MTKTIQMTEMPLKWHFGQQTMNKTNLKFGINTGTQNIVNSKLY